jgi:hypothetical protein
MQLSPHDPFSSMFAAARAFSSYMAEDYSGGLEWARRAVRMNPDLAGYWRPRALCAAALGLDEEAKGAVAAVIRLQSDFSVAWVEESPIAHPEDRARYCETLRPFGLPEK